MNPDRRWTWECVHLEVSQELEVVMSDGTAHTTTVTRYVPVLIWTSPDGERSAVAAERLT